ncbi:uncharacterized protein LOC135218296 [Macrobrachium nipponense]|uniref:uncharacterized protein LOC135218296 n=1 Tax=Macrobrachium nipponense TaxID=159736 RepID=UPI0030C8AA00
MSEHDQKAYATEDPEADRVTASAVTDDRDSTVTGDSAVNDDRDSAILEVVTKPEDQQVRLEPIPPEEESLTPRAPDRVVSAPGEPCTSPGQIADDGDSIVNLNPSQDQVHSQSIVKVEEGTSTAIAQELIHSRRRHTPVAGSVVNDPPESQVDLEALQRDVLQYRRENKELKRLLALCEEIYQSSKLGYNGNMNF